MKKTTTILLTLLAGGWGGTTSAAPAIQLEDGAGRKVTWVNDPNDTRPVEEDMVLIKGGCFLMGSPQGEGYSDEHPQHQVCVNDFALARYEVTFAQWDRCVADGGCTHKPDDRGWGRRNRPVINVSWQDIQQYTAWLSRRTGKRYRLPSEAEWEYAARAGTTTKYSWGDDIGINRANCNGCGSQWDNKRTAPVGSFASNPLGLYDMHGNVWEWVQDCWNDGYKEAPTDGSAWTQGDCSRRILRGGSWNGQPGNLRAAFRNRNLGENRNDGSGFRTARTVIP